jgi:hypothetical protein
MFQYIEMFVFLSDMSYICVFCFLPAYLFISLPTYVLYWYIFSENQNDALEEPVILKADSNKSAHNCLSGRLSLASFLLPPFLKFPGTKSHPRSTLHTPLNYFAHG